MERKKNYMHLLDSIQEDGDDTPLKKHDRVLILDGLNLFFRNFAALNMINPKGAHIGGLGGFLRSLGAMIRITSPTSVYLIFDGQASSQSRKNIISEYKEGRGAKRITNWDIFDNLSEEDDAKIEQLVRVIQYLKLLPVKIIIIDKVEADDVIAVLSKELPIKYNSQVFIISSDQDFIQLVNKNVILYRPMERVFYTSDQVLIKYGVLQENFIIYKTLMGDNSDKLLGVKGLGAKKLFKFFPELATQPIDLEFVFKRAEEKYKDHIIFARILQDWSRLEDSYKIMDLSNPLISEKEIKYLGEVIEEDVPILRKKEFLELYEKDQLGGIIRNLESWVKDYFIPLNNYN